MVETTELLIPCKLYQSSNSSKFTVVVIFLPRKNFQYYLASSSSYNFAISKCSNLCVVEVLQQALGSKKATGHRWIFLVEAAVCCGFYGDEGGGVNGYGIDFGGGPGFEGAAVAGAGWESVGIFSIPKSITVTPPLRAAAQSRLPFCGRRISIASRVLSLSLWSPDFLNPSINYSDSASPIGGSDAAHSSASKLLSYPLRSATKPKEKKPPLVHSSYSSAHKGELFEALNLQLESDLNVDQTMMSQYRIKLVAYLISSSYGDFCSKVCECLLSRGTLTLAQIIRFTELSRENFINCLRVLIHQNCVQAFSIQQEVAFGEAPKIVTQYMALFENTIHKMRFPKFMQIVSEELGKDCLGIFEGLLQHGRLSLNQIIDRNMQTPDNSDVHAVPESFSRLLNARFVERCPAPEPFLAPPEEETPAKKRGTKSAKIAEAPKTIEQRALATASPMESIRFLMEIDTLRGTSEEKGMESHDIATLEEKWKQDFSDAELSSSGKKKEILWRVNFEEFVRRLRHKACIEYVRIRLSDQAGIVLSAILELTRSSETRLKTDKSASMSINDIYDEVIKKDGGLDMDLERVRASLVQLGCQISTTGIDETYSIDLKNIIELAQNEEVESVVLKRYGREAYRIFSLLSKSGRLLETDKKVSVNGPKQTLFLLWEVDKESLWVRVLDEMYHAALNLRLRITYEQDQEKEILQLPTEKLVGELEKRYKRLRKVRIILESSLMNLDDALMLFHDF
ncbi:RNA polymerase III subunit RPC82 family protein [Abeliophyllum distichum]|uniref:DNA-directed RNA polymerase III subunit RPC3 n=1 Tax=Abeliophyllum distichum TaxID=126358 RepID=A0ABD1PNQ7_9LAMI